MKRQDAGGHRASNIANLQDEGWYWPYGEPGGDEPDSGKWIDIWVIIVAVS